MKCKQLINNILEVVLVFSIIGVIGLLPSYVSATQGAAGTVPSIANQGSPVEGRYSEMIVSFPASMPVTNATTSDAINVDKYTMAALTVYRATESEVYRPYSGPLAGVEAATMYVAIGNLPDVTQMTTTYVESVTSASNLRSSNTHIDMMGVYYVDLSAVKWMRIVSSATADVRVKLK